LSIELLDEAGTAIAAAIFNRSIDLFNDMLKEGQVYLFSNGTVKLAAKRFTSIKNDFILNLDQTSTIIPVPEDDTIKSLEITCVTLSDVAKLPANSVVDVIAVVKSLCPIMDFVAKTGRKTVKRSIKVIDNTNIEIEMNLWNTCTNAKLAERDVVAFKNVRIVAFNGKQLSSADQTSVIPNPKHPHADMLRKWLTANPDLSKLKQLTAESGETERVYVFLYAKHNFIVYC